VARKSGTGLVESRSGGWQGHFFAPESVRMCNKKGMIPSELLLEGYRRGAFPMGREGGGIDWFSPDPRGVIPIEGFHLPHGLRRTLAKGAFEIRINRSFREVMVACSERDETWITPPIVESYCRLHELGYAHSVEAWHAGELAGGLYGVAIGGAFFGESMFHRVTDASKVSLAALVERLQSRGYGLLDTQWVTPHLRTFGAYEIPRTRYLRQLRECLGRHCQFLDRLQP
jgi:leucyl/phenylalanyl-tRNA--protein transferase